MASSLLGPLTFLFLWSISTPVAVSSVSLSFAWFVSIMTTFLFIRSFSVLVWALLFRFFSLLKYQNNRNSVNSRHFLLAFLLFHGASSLFLNCFPLVIYRGLNNDLYAPYETFLLRFFFSLKISFYSQTHELSTSLHFTSMTRPL